MSALEARGVTVVRAGRPIVDGLEMLVQQGALSYESWTGAKPDLDAMRQAARDFDAPPVRTDTR